MDRLVLSLLGGFRARLESGPGVDVPTRKGQALLGYLACAPLERHARDTLATLLWGDTTQRHARQSLRQTLCVLRAALGTAGVAVLHARSDSVSLDATGLIIDVVDFERLAREATPPSLEAAAELYHGDLLAGIAVGDPAFEEWLRAQRERLHELALEVFARLLSHHCAAGATEAAIQSGLRLLALDSLQEAVHRTLMRLYARASRPGAALRQYRLCASALRELGLEPAPETTALVHDLLPRGARTEPDDALTLH